MTKLLSGVTIHKSKQSLGTLGHVQITLPDHLLTVTMSDDEYDKLSKEEREAKDKSDRKREASEQAGKISLNGSIVVCLMAPTVT